MELIQWGGHGGIAFFTSPTEIRAFKDLNVSVSSVTEDKTVDGEKYTDKKSAGGYKITLTAILSAAMGVDVQNVALAITESARLGEQGYFYINNNKLFPSSFMSTDATISKISVTGNGTWSYCEVSWTLKQCGKYNDSADGGDSDSGRSGTSSGAGGGSGKVSKSGNNLVENSKSDDKTRKIVEKTIGEAVEVVARANEGSRYVYNPQTGVSQKTRNQYTITNTQARTKYISISQARTRSLS